MQVVFFVSDSDCDGGGQQVGKHLSDFSNLRAQQNLLEGILLFSNPLDKPKTCNCMARAHLVKSIDNLDESGMILKFEQNVNSQNCG